MCPGEGLHECLASRFVAVAMSGQVEMLSQLRDPTRDWKCLVCWRRWEGVSAVVGWIESIWGF